MEGLIAVLTTLLVFGWYMVAFVYWRKNRHSKFRLAIFIAASIAVALLGYPSDVVILVAILALRYTWHRFVAR